VTATAPPVRRQERRVLAGTAALAAAAWLALALVPHWAGAAGGHRHGAAGLVDPVGFGLAWLVMVAAMMLPPSADFVLALRRLLSARPRGGPLLLAGMAGYEAPTLLQPWTTRDLAAHLVLRERDHLAGPGLVLTGAWGRFAERRRRALALRDYSGLVATIRSGPPPGFFRIGWVRRFPTLNELFVHHEDVRRANGRRPRTNEQALDQALWRNVSRAPWFLARRLRGAGLELQWGGTANTVRARRGEPTVRVAGSPGELLLYLFGRQGAAHVEVSGPAAAVEAVRRARFGM
jgi:uncharacterized protein (TIGR03085 family)